MRKSFGNIMFLSRVFLLVLTLVTCELIEMSGAIWENPLGDFFAHERKTTQHKASNRELASALCTGDTCKAFLENPEVSQSACSSFFPRFVNLFLRSLNIKDRDLNVDELKKISIDVQVSQKALKVLQSYGSGGDVPYDELDESFTSLFESEGGYGFMPDIGGWFSFSLDYSPMFILLMPILMISVIIFIILKKLNASSIIVIVLFIYYILSVGLDFYTQYEDIYTKRILVFEETFSVNGKEKIPDECFPSKLSIMQKIFSLLSSEDPCKRYLQAKKSMLSEIDVERAFMKPFIGFLYSSLPQMGDKVGQSVKNFSGHFSFPLNWIISISLIYGFMKYSVPSFIFNIFNTDWDPHWNYWKRRIDWRQRECIRESIDQRETSGSHDPRPVAESPTPSGHSVVNNFFINGQEPSQVIPKSILPSKEMRLFQKKTFNRKKELLLSKRNKKK